MPQDTDNERTTITTSRYFANLLNTLARDAGISAREYCDRELAPAMKDKAKKAAKRHLQSIELGGEAG